jgi:hypothetical protein
MWGGSVGILRQRQSTCKRRLCQWFVVTLLRLLLSSANPRVDSCHFARHRQPLRPRTGILLKSTTFSVVLVGTQHIMVSPISARKNSLLKAEFVPVLFSLQRVGSNVAEYLTRLQQTAYELEWKNTSSIRIQRIRCKSLKSSYRVYKQAY